MADDLDDTQANVVLPASRAEHDDDMATVLPRQLYLELQKARGCDEIYHFYSDHIMTEILITIGSN